MPVKNRLAQLCPPTKHITPPQPTDIPRDSVRNLRGIACPQALKLVPPPDPDETPAMGTQAPPLQVGPANQLRSFIELELLARSSLAASRLIGDRALHRRRHRSPRILH